MKSFSTIVALAASVVAAQRPTNESICDYYTTALLKNNTAANQETLLTLVVNTAVIGNYTQPNVGIAVPGILAPGLYNGQVVNLAPYFTGALASSNRGGSKGVSVNFLDGGAAAPLMNNMPANSNTTAQYKLLTHLYGYFGYLLGCSQFANTTMPYQGSTNMYQTHKFMDLDAAQVGWFIEQVGLSAASFGVAKEDVTAVGMALNETFGYRCSPNASVPATAAAAPQAICIASDCPLAANATCSNYAAAFPPANATTNMTVSMTGSPSASHSATGSAAASSGSATGSKPSTPTGTNAAGLVEPFMTLGVAALFGVAFFAV